MSYSVPVHATLSLTELRPHLHTLPGRPDWIPYRTSYYREDWAFCLSHQQIRAWKRLITKYVLILISGRDANLRRVLFTGRIDRRGPHFLPRMSSVIG